MDIRKFITDCILKEELMKRFNKHDDYERYMMQSGWKVLGTGAFARVYGKSNKNYVIKIYRESTQSYDKFLSFIESQPQNPHLPKIKRKILNKTPDSLGVVAIEKLNPIKTKGSDEWLDLMMDYLHMYCNTQATDSAYPSTNFNQFVEGYEEFYIDKIMNHINKYDTDKASGNISPTDIKWKTEINTMYKKTLKRLNFFIESYLPVIKTIHSLLLFCRKELGPKAWADLHIGNFMIRPSTGEVVITDPIAL